jgi:hypothetical protein
VLALVLAVSLSQAEPPPETRAYPPRPQVEVSVAVRVALGLAAGVLGAAAGLGLSLAVASGNPQLDVSFSTAALAALLVTGGVFTVHEALGGRGEVTLALALCLASFAVAGVVAQRLDGTAPLTPILVASLGALPASGLAVLGLELTSPPRRGVSVLVGPGGLVVRF